MTLSKQLLDRLACPKCRGGLDVVEENAAGSPPGGLACRACSLLYEVREGIPVMIIEQARPLAGDMS